MPVPLTQIDKSQQTAADGKYPNKSRSAGTLTLVFTIRHKASNQVVKEHRLVCMPTTFEQSTEGRSQLYYTQQGIYVDLPQREAIGITTFNISGHTLYRGLIRNSEPAGLTRSGEPTTISAAVTNLVGVFNTLRTGPAPRAGSTIDGAAAIKDLQDTIRQYFFGNDNANSVTNTPEATPGDLQLEFFNMNAPISAQDSVGLAGWIIHPHRGLVTLRQDAHKPFLWTYSFQFAGIQLLKEATKVDSFVQTFTNKKSLIGTVLDRLDKVVTGANTLFAAFDQLTINVFKPVSTFVTGVANLADSAQRFVTGLDAKIRFPLYAAQSLLQSGKTLLSLPSHTVQTLHATAHALQDLLHPLTVGRSLGAAFAGTSLTAGVNDRLRIALNGEPPRTLTLGTQTSGPAIAQTIQAQLRAQTPTFTANASAYADLTCVYQPEDGRYVITSGTFGSNSASVVVSTPEDLALEPNDASPVLGLGPANGGIEQQGSAEPLAALDLLREVTMACSRLEAFPEYFAESLPAQTALLQTYQPAPVPDEVIEGEQRLSYVLLTRGDSLQSLAARSGVAWETLALVNHLTYPYVMDGPATLAQGLVTVTGQVQSLTDTTKAWLVQEWQGQRVDLIRGDGAGQSRKIVANSSTTLYLDEPWTLVPTANTAYAVRMADNPFIQTSTVTNASHRTVVDSSLHLVPESQRGYELRLLSGPGAGQRRRIEEHTPTTYVLADPWDVIPHAGTLYAIVTPQAPVRRRVLLIGDPVAIPRPARYPSPRNVRFALQDLATITGTVRSQDTKLFGTDLVHSKGDLVLDQARQDLHTVSGLPNLRQAVLNLLNLSLGELEYMPTLGSYLQEHLGRVATLPSGIELMHSVERTVRQDARIAQIGPTSLVASAGTVELYFEAVAINGEVVDRIAIR
jgi:phage baseplate assembly protein W